MTDAVLEPKLTKRDERVLAALDCWEDDRDIRERPLEWRTLWDIGARLKELDLADLRRTLDGLVHLGYATSSAQWDIGKRAWIATPWRRRETNAPNREGAR